MPKENSHSPEGYPDSDNDFPNPVYAFPDSVSDFSDLLNDFPDLPNANPSPPNLYPTQLRPVSHQPHARANPPAPNSDLPCAQTYSTAAHTS